MPQTQQVNNNDDFGLDKYYQDAVNNLDLNNHWLLTVAGLLGAAFVTQSLQPVIATKPIVEETVEETSELPLELATTPIAVKDISDESFSNIMQMNISKEDIASYLYNEDEMGTFKQLGEELRQHGRLEDPNTIENTAFSNAVNSNDKMGMFSDMEAYRSGALDTYIQATTEYGASIRIPWSPTGDNTCDECQALADNGPYDPEDFPEPPHYGCQCNDPMADPEIVFPEEDVFSSWTTKLKRFVKKGISKLLGG